MISTTHDRRLSIGLLILRLVFGTAFVIHGFGKIQHPFTWVGNLIAGTPAWLQAIGAGIEFFGGFAMIVGIATPPFAALLACQMVVVIFFVALPHGEPFIRTSGTGPDFELPLVYLTIAALLLLAGAGRFSIDAREQARKRRPPLPRRRDK